MRNLKDLKVLTEQDLQWPPSLQPELEACVIPVAKRKGRLLLAVPLDVIPKTELGHIWRGSGGGALEVAVCSRGLGG